jgi:hypothetical protein
MKTFKTLVRESPLLPLARSIHTLVRVSRLFLPARNLHAMLWGWGHMPRLANIPPPHSYKQLLVKRYAKKYELRTLVETGTLHGHMVEASARYFDHILSVELGDALHQAASDRFADRSHIKILHGDSADQIPQILEELTGPALFWLDAHFSGGVTVGEGANPLENEVIAILSAAERGHVILMDDVRKFDGTDGYPTTDQLQELVKEARPDLRFSVNADIARIEPK